MRRINGPHTCQPSPSRRASNDPRPLLPCRLTGCGPKEYVLRCTARGPLIELNARLEQLQGQELLR